MNKRDVSFPALVDLKRAFALRRVIVYMAMSDLKARYKRSVLGPFWLTISTAIGSAGLGFLWSELMKLEMRTFVPMLTVGLILWQFISGTITEATSQISRQATIIRNIDLPLSIYPAQLLLRQFINLLHNMPVFVVVALVLGVEFNTNVWLVIPAIFVVSMNLLWIALIVSLLGARFRDLEYFIGSVMPLLMFLSPVFYRPDYLPFSANIIWINPISHLIEIVRYPLLGNTPPSFLIATNIGMLVIGWTVALWFFNRKCNRVAFWV